MSTEKNLDSSLSDIDECNNNDAEISYLEPIPKELIDYGGYMVENKPIEDLEEGQVGASFTMIKLPIEANLKPAGKYLHKIGCLHIVEASLNGQILDVDTVLFISDGQMFGVINDIFGSVNGPKYIIIDASKNIPDISQGLELFYTDFYAGNTNFVDLEKMKKEPFNDASNENGAISQDSESDHELSNIQKQNILPRKRNRKSKKQTINPVQQFSANNIMQPQFNYPNTQIYNPDPRINQNIYPQVPQFTTHYYDYQHGAYPQNQNYQWYYPRNNQ